MSELDAGAVEAALDPSCLDRLDSLDVFAEIESTNSYLLRETPAPVGRFRAAVAGHQTQGRGRQQKNWWSEPGASLCLSVGYTFETPPDNFPALTLALGVGTAEGFGRFGIPDIRLKWPNDIVANDGKLGGILAESQHRGVGTTVVAGIGINLAVPAEAPAAFESGWAHAPVGLQSLTDNAPARPELAGMLVSQFVSVISTFESEGIDGFRERWRNIDWLHGREILIDTGSETLRGSAAGVADDGALLLDVDGNTERIIGGSITLAERAAS